jgi:MarR family transcriptional regulator for hemolysin
MDKTLDIKQLDVKRLCYSAAMAAPPPLLPPIGLRLARTARVLSQEFESAMAEAGGSAAAWQVLLLVRSQEWGTQAQLAEAMGITGATLTHHLNALESRGLVRRWREASNKRVQQMALTDEGQALFDRLRGVALRHDERLRSDLTDEETAQLAALLDRLAAGAQERSSSSSESPISQSIGGHKPTKSARRSALPRSS